VRSRLAFLTRLVFLKLMAFLTLVLLIVYAPATTKTLWNGAGDVSVVLAKAIDGGLQFVGSELGMKPKQGSVELLSHIVGLDKVILFIGITITLYVGWLILFAAGRGAVHRLDPSGSPRKREAARIQAGPPR